MMNYIWAFIILISLIFGIFTGSISDVSASMLSGAQSGIELILSMMGAMCFWSGLMKIAEDSHLTDKIARLINPVIRRLMPDIKPNGKAMNAICMNITANLLGLGNAATPLGLCAMKEMQKENHLGSVASNSMVMFVVMNTASIELIPTTAAILRANHGAAVPFDIVPCIWISSVIGLVSGIIAAKLLSSRNKLKQRAMKAARS